MNIYDRANKDIQQITSNKNGAGTEIKLSTPDGSTTVNIIGIHTKIHLGVDTEGNMVNAKKSHISFSEQLLTTAGYPVRNSKGEVDLNGHLVEVKDSTGITKKYTMQNIFPDEAVGLISCTLEDYDG